MEQLATLLERLITRLPRAGLASLLLVLTLLAVLPAFTTLPPVDRDEPRFAQSSKQMVQSWNPIDIRFQDTTRYKKPVGIYWLQAATVAVTGSGANTAIWKYRLPSLAAVLLSVLLSASIAGLFGGRLAAAAAGLFMSGNFLLLVEGHLATTDASLLAAILASQAVLARLYAANAATGFDRQAPAPLSRRAQILFWAALGASVLLKGPIGPLVIGTTALVLALRHRRAGWLKALRPLNGLLILAIVILPWFLAITIKSGGAFWSESIGHDLMGKVAGAQENHGAPPGSYLTALWLTFFPASIALAVSLPAIWRHRATPGITFALAWAIPSWLLFEASPTKLLHYVLPLYPALALAAALVWEEVVQNPLRRWQKIVAALIAALGLVLLLAVAVYASDLGTLPIRPVALGGALLLAGFAFARTSFRMGHATAAALGLWLMGLGLTGGALTAAARVPELWPAPAIVALAPATATCPLRPIVTDGYDEPSLVFLSAGGEKATTPQAAAEAMAATPCTLAAISDSAAFLAKAATLSITPKEAGKVAGLNLGTGHKIALTVYTLQ